MKHKYRGFVDKRTRSNHYTWLRGIDKLEEHIDTLKCEVDLDLLDDHKIEHEFTADGDLFISASISEVSNLANCQKVNTGKSPNFMLHYWETVGI